MRAAKVGGSASVTGLPCTSSALSRISLSAEALPTAVESSEATRRFGADPLSASSSSYFSAASRSSTRRPETSWPSREPTCSRLPLPSVWSSWCFESAAMAFLRFVTYWTRSFSSSRNSPASLSRIAVACSSIALSDATCALRLAIVAESSPKRAPRLSTSPPSSMSFASASAMAFVFSFSLVSHQQTILSYMPDSLLASSSSSAFILPSRATTRCTGLTLELLSRDQAASSDFSRDATPADWEPCAARTQGASARMATKATRKEAMAGGRDASISQW
mmetsp:Transcript_2851/g.7389  ORF Transcript_2851/g.7389 Transcript_2851/m.7389 type:complete len:278 (+) Transcript_2851:1475-2308(+)